MRKNSEISNFRNNYKFYVWLLILVIVYTGFVGFVLRGVVSLELLVAGLFLVFLALTVYLGSLIIELDKKIEELNKKLEK